MNARRALNYDICFGMEKNPALNVLAKKVSYFQSFVLGNQKFGG